MARSCGASSASRSSTGGLVPGNDPRQREQSNVALLTGDADYDLVFVADSEGEFARYVRSRPIGRPGIGSEGLIAGGAIGPGSGTEPRSWGAVKAVVEAGVRARTTD